MAGEIEIPAGPLARLQRLGWRFEYDPRAVAVFAVHHFGGRHQVVEVYETPAADVDTIGEAIAGRLNGTQ